MKILKVYDNEGKTIDRYTVVTDEKYNDLYYCLHLSAYPEHPCGVSLWGECEIGAKYLGKEISFNELSTEIQKHVKRRFAEVEE